MPFHSLLGIAGAIEKALVDHDIKARAMGRHLVCEIARRYTINATDMNPLEFNGFYWTPGSQMKLALQVN